MGKKLRPKDWHLLKITLAVGMLLGCAVFFMAMNLLSGPGKVCWTNNDFGEYWPEVILMANAILWGVGFLVWNVRIYRAKPEPKEEDEWE